MQRIYGGCGFEYLIESARLVMGNDLFIPKRKNKNLR